MTAAAAPFFGGATRFSLPSACLSFSSVFGSTCILPNADASLKLADAVARCFIWSTLLEKPRLSLLPSFESFSSSFDAFDGDDSLDSLSLSSASASASGSSAAIASRMSSLLNVFALAARSSSESQDRFASCGESRMMRILRAMMWILRAMMWILRAMMWILRAMMGKQLKGVTTRQGP
eukprot:1180321-Prorocentrum_minimum.AAC.1